MALIYALVSVFFLMNAVLDVSWRLLWVVFGAIVVWSIVVTALRLVRFEAAHFDTCLFSFFIFFFVVLEPVVYALSGLDFPFPWGTEIRDNNVANGTGAIMSVFLMSYYAGRIPFNVRRRSRRNTEPSPPAGPQVRFTSGIVLFFSVLSTYPFFAFGSSGLVENLMINITGRQTGYVAFSGGALGSSDPISVLIAQLIPVMVVLNAVMTATEKKLSKKALHALVFVFLFVLLISLGGRTWVVLVALTLLSILYFNSTKLSDRLFFFVRFAFFMTIVIGALQYQIQQRNTGYSEASNSGFVGADMNREIALIYDTVPEQEEFVIAETFLEQVVLPVPTYLFLVITNPIPRIIWNGKPFDPSFVFVNELRTGNTGLGTGSNVTVSIPGRAYVNFGWPGVIQHGFVLGLLLSRLARRMPHTSSVSTLGIIYIFTICLIAVNFRELQAGKLYPIFWMIGVFLTQKVLNRVLRGYFHRSRVS